MNEAIESLRSLGTIIPLVIVVALGIFAIVALCLVAKRVVLHIDSNDQNFAATLALAKAKGARGPAPARLLLGVVGCIDQELPGTAQVPQRWIVRCDVTEAYERACEAALRGRNWFARLFVGIGHSLTGISLVFTFGLIAWVLASEVPSAIRGVASSDPSAIHLGNESLRVAVGLVGVKFMISALGLLFSLFFSAVEAHRADIVKDKAAQSIHRHLALFLSREGHTMQVLSEHLAHLEEGMARVADTVAAAGQEAVSATNRQSGELAGRLEKLASIEVSVKDMGNQVSAHLGKIMKQAIADQICEALAELRNDADKISTALAQSFAQVTAHEMAQVRSSLETVRAAVADQGQGQLSSLIENMRNMMSGGFRSESQGMVEAMTGLRETIPRLEEQLRRMAEDVDRGVRERNEATQKVQNELLAQMEATLASNRESQAASQKAAAALLENAERSTVELQSRIAGSGEEMVQRLVQTAMANFGDLRNQFEKLNALAAGNVGDFSREVAAAREALAETRTGLVSTLGTVRAMAEQLRAGLDGNLAASTNTRRTIETYERATQLVQSTSERLSETIKHLDEQLRREQGILTQQRELAEQVIPALLKDSSQTLQRQNDHLLAAWDRLANTVRQTVDGAGESLEGAVEDLGERVGSLKDVVEKAVRSKA